MPFKEKLHLLRDKLLIDRANEIISDLQRYIPDVNNLQLPQSTPISFETLPIPAPQLTTQVIATGPPADQNENLKVTGTFL